MIILATLSASLVSCGIVTGDTVMQYGDYKITEAMYSYWLSSFKSYFLYYYGETGNYEALWDQTLPDGRTYLQFFEDFMASYSRKVLICMKLFDDHGVSFPKEKRAEIEERIDELIKNYGGKAELNAYLGEYGLNIKTLERIYYEEAKVDVVSDYLFTKGGELELTDAERQAYYESNYYCVNWIYIYTEQKPDTESGGKGANAHYNMIELSDEEKAQKKQLVADILARLQAGESFGELKAKYCEQKNEDGTSDYDYLPNGFNLCANSYSDGYGAELIKVIQGMQTGEYATYTDKYATRIIVRNPLTEYKELTPQEINFMVDFESYAVGDKLDRHIEGIAGVKINTEVADRYRDIKAVKTIDMSI